MHHDARPCWFSHGLGRGGAMTWDTHSVCLSDLGSLLNRIILIFSHRCLYSTMWPSQSQRTSPSAPPTAVLSSTGRRPSTTCSPLCASSSCLWSSWSTATRGSLSRYPAAWHGITVSLTFSAKPKISDMRHKKMFSSLPVVSRDVHLRRSHNNIPKARMRTLKMSIVIVTSFIICWTPYYLLGLWYWLFPEKMEETVSHSLTHMLFIFGLFNACLDPITYGLFTIHLRQGLKRCCQSSNTRTEFENNTCHVHMARLSSHRQIASSGNNTDIEEGNNKNSKERGSRPIIPVSRLP